MRKTFTALLVVLAAVFAFFFYYRGDLSPKKIQQQVTEKIKPLEKYEIEKLSSTNFTPSQITIGDVISEDPNFISRNFYFYVDGKKISGLINIPTKPGTYPIIEMNRGYIEKEGYKTGSGTQHSAEVFAQNGFITLAPDFLGFGQSDAGSDSSFEDRFQTYTTVLTLLASLPNLNGVLPEGVSADFKKVFLWGHSNGGQIALTILEISGRPYPSVLWAPVTKPFPYSILYYTYDWDDHGKAMRKALANFERDYDAEKFSLTNYFDRIKAPIQLHQGTADEAVPVLWSDKFVEELKKLDSDISYFVYPGEDHNFANGSWSTVVSRNIQFFRKFL